MGARNTDFPLWNDPSARFTPWIVALMVYLATISLLISLTINSTLNHWDQGFSNKLTIEIAPAVMSFSEGNLQINEQEAEEAIRILRHYPGIKTFRLLNRAEMLKMVQPWFGQNDPLQELPLSTLIDVEVNDHDQFNVDFLKKKIQEKLPNATVEDHQIWKKGLFNMAYTIKTISILVVLFIFIAAIFTITFTTQTSLIIHKHIIHILHLMGAKNQYIAKQFQIHTLYLGLKGSFVGVIFTALTVLIFENFLSKVDTTFLTRVISSWDIWAITILVPLLIIFFMVISARFTTLLMLRKL